MPGRCGPIKAKASVVSVSPSAPKGQQAVFHLRTRELARQQAADADADAQRGQWKAGLPVRQSQLARVVGHDRRRNQRADRPDEDLSEQGQAEHAVGPDRSPGHANGVASPPSARAGATGES